MSGFSFVPGFGNATNSLGLVFVYIAVVTFRGGAKLGPEMRHGPSILRGGYLKKTQQTPSDAML